MLMTETSDTGDSPFRDEAWWALVDLTSAASDAAVREALADPTVLGRRTAVECAALASADRGTALEPALAAARARFTADELERALLPHAVTAFDGDPTRALALKVLVHPEYGLGVLGLISPPSDSDGDWTFPVTFRGGARDLCGAAAHWESAHDQFAQAARRAIRVAGMAEDKFWDLAHAIGWGAPTSDCEALAKPLVARASYLECLAADRCRHVLQHALMDRIDSWSASTGTLVECGDDSFNDLTDHIVGLGRDAYAAVFESPGLAVERVNRRDYQESFSYVFSVAERLYSVEEIALALRDLAADGIREDPLLGVGIVLPDGGIQFATRIRRPSSP